MSRSNSMSTPSLPLSTQEDNIGTIPNVNAKTTGNIPRNRIQQPDAIFSSTQFKQYNNRRDRLETQSMSQNSDTNKWFGDKLEFHPQWVTGEYTETFRVGALNINGISKQLDWLEWDIIIQTMSNLQIDMMGLTEPNINFKNKRTMLQLRDIAKKTDRNVQLSASCSNQLNFTEKKMGGTLSILSGRWAGRKVGTDNDPKGRWSSITLNGKKDRMVTLITAYRVCQQKGGIGSTVFHQQQLDFEEEGLKQVNLRKQFCKDMVQYVRDLHSKNQIVILLGDFNDDLNLAGGQVNTMLRDCNLSNVCTNRHDDIIKLPATYHRGTKCLDMIAITNDPRIPKQCIVRAGFLPFYHHFCTDHRMVYCDINTDMLFGKVIPDLTRWTNRPFTTDNLKQCDRFKLQLRKLYKKANLFKIVEDLDKKFKDSKGDDIKELIQECIKYGNTSGELLLAAGRKTGRVAYHKGKPYSDELTQTAKKLHKKGNYYNCYYHVKSPLLITGK
jgi:hypothetical protein